MSLINKHLLGDNVIQGTMLGPQEKIRQINAFKKFTAKEEVKTVPK